MKTDRKDEIFFTEKQRFTQWWLWLILLGINAIFLYGIYVQLITEQPFGSNPMSNTGLIFATVFIVLLTVLFISIRLDTLIKTDRIYVRLFPLHISFRHYGWDEIRIAHIRQYSPVKEFGGWGIRYGLGGRGKAYNVSGNIGLQLERIK